MLLSSNEIKGYSLEATDGAIGKAKDFLFNDEHWVIRYLVADTAAWLVGRKVLLSPIALGNPDYRTKSLEVKLTKEQIKDSPPLDSDKPVSRQFEIDYYRFYGWPAYWTGDFLWGTAAYPMDLYAAQPAPAAEELITDEDGDPHLRSMNEVHNYHIKAADGEIGHVEDFIIDDETWNIRYLVVDTRNWLPGRKVTVSPQWITDIDFGKALVHTDLTTEVIRESPEYDPSAPINREYEIQLYDFYGRRYYW